MEGFIGELARYLFVLVTAPIWLPIARVFWKELNRALRWDGGVFGRSPTARELRELEETAAMEESPLVSEPLAGAGQRAGIGFRRGPSGVGSGAPRRGAPRPGGGRTATGARGAVRRGGFR